MSNVNSLIRFNWWVLVFIYLVVIAGSFVRITGSGMGCPDWPKCFGQWVPPTDEAQLDSNYREIHAEKRAIKIEKFARFLSAIGLTATAEKITSDPDLRKEEVFNARKTWTEYVNRLFGFLAGNGMLLAFIWLLWKHRSSKLIILSLTNLVLMAIQAWFGSIVVASNLVPWTITVHMLLALVIIALQLRLIFLLDPSATKKLNLSKTTKLVVLIILGITFYQMFLGTQVREAIDILTKQGFNRAEWIDRLGWSFLIHRSFSWLVLIMIVWLAWKNEKTEKHTSIRLIFVLLALELISGVLLAYVNMPGLVQTLHLLMATLLFGLLIMLSYRMLLKPQMQ